MTAKRIMQLGIWLAFAALVWWGYALLVFQPAALQRVEHFKVAIAGMTDLHKVAEQADAAGAERIIWSDQAGGRRRLAVFFYLLPGGLGQTFEVCRFEDSPFTLLACYRR